MRSFVLSRARAANYPGILYEIVQNIGEEATAKLIAKHGGTSFYVPSRMFLNHALARLLGLEAAQYLAAEYGGLTVEIPRAVSVLRDQRNRLIRADLATGLSQHECAIKYKLTTRTVRKIKKLLMIDETASHHTTEGNYCEK
jgi:Mor family transcriptional regulator